MNAIEEKIHRARLLGYLNVHHCLDQQSHFYQKVIGQKANGASYVEIPERNAVSDLLVYLYEQFPATVGHIPLSEKILAVWKEGHTQGVADSISAIVQRL